MWCNDKVSRQAAPQARHTTTARPRPPARVGRVSHITTLAGGLKPICAGTTATSQVWAYTGVVMSRPSQHRFPSRGPSGAGAVLCRGEREGPDGATGAQTADSMCFIMGCGFD